MLDNDGWLGARLNGFGGGGVPFYQTARDLFIDPSNVSGRASDGNSGLDVLNPWLTMAAFRRRVQGASFTSIPVVTLMSSSTNDDDADVSGFQTPTGVSTVFVALKGVPTVLRTGTLTAGTVSPSGNTRGIVEDTSLSNSWASAGLVSSPANGVRMIRKVGANVHSFILAQTANTKRAEIGIPTNVSETPTGVIGNTAVNFASGDAYEVCSLPSWPTLKTQFGGRVRPYLLDFGGSTIATLNARILNDDVLQPVLCGFKVFTSINSGGIAALWNCCFVSGASLSGRIQPHACSFVGPPAGTPTVQQITGPGRMVGENCTFSNSQLWIAHFSDFDPDGDFRFFDLPSNAAALTVSEGARARLVSVSGAGNAGALLLVTDATVMNGGTVSAAASSKVLPVTLNGVDYAVPTTSPIIDTDNGAFIYV